MSVEDRIERQPTPPLWSSDPALRVATGLEDRVRVRVQNLLDLRSNSSDVGNRLVPMIPGRRVVRWRESDGHDVVEVEVRGHRYERRQLAERNVCPDGRFDSSGQGGEAANDGGRIGTRRHRLQHAPLPAHPYVVARGFSLTHIGESLVSFEPIPTGLYVDRYPVLSLSGRRHLGLHRSGHVGANAAERIDDADEAGHVDERIEIDVDPQQEFHGVTQPRHARIDLVGGTSRSTCGYTGRWR